MNTSELPLPTEPLPTFYAETLELLERGDIPFLIGGAFAQSRYTKRNRQTKDLDIVMMRRDVPAALALFEGAGYETDLIFPHWLAKVRTGNFVLDIVFSSGNGVVQVDEDWFTHAVDGEVLGKAVKLCPVEELLWSKAFIQERERFDGSDVLQLLHARAAVMDWDRLIVRFGEHWAVLLGHIVLFQYVYPDRRSTIPGEVMEMLLDRFQRQRTEPNNPLCYGPLLSRKQYLFDITRLAYHDARLEPYGEMTQSETEIWTAAIDKE